MRRLAPSRDAGVALLLAAGALGLYVATLAPGLAYDAGDAHELTVVASTLGLAHPTGYPLYTWLGFLFTRLVPAASLAYRTNLMSAVFGAAGIGMLYLVGRRLRLHPAAAAFGAALFAVSATFWSQAVVTEVYAPNVFALALTLWLALRWADGVEAGPVPARDDRRFAFFALAYGLSLGMHFSNLGFAPAHALFALLVDRRILARPRAVVLAVSAFLVGASQFAWLPLRAGFNDVFPNPPPDTWARFHAYMLGAFAGWRNAFPPEAVPARIVAYLGLVSDGFTRAGVVLAFAGMGRLAWCAPRRFWLLFVAWAVLAGAFLRTFLIDLDVFFVPSHAVVALFVAAGADAVRAGLGRVAVRLRTAGAAPVLHGAAALAGVAALVVVGRASFHVNDRRTDTATEDFYDSVFDVLPVQSVLVPLGRGSFASAPAYWRLTREGRRPDVVIATDRGARPPVDHPATFVAQTTLPLGVSRAFLRRDATFTAVLRGSRRDLVLYRVDPPPRPDADPARSAAAAGTAVLMAGEVVTMRSYRPARVHVRSTWRVADPGAMPVVSSRIGGVTVEAHRLGGEVVPTDAGTVVREEIDLVVPSHLTTGRHPVELGAIELADGRITPHWTVVGSAVIEQ